jgi:hypothetical protein
MLKNKGGKGVPLMKTSTVLDPLAGNAIKKNIYLTIVTEHFDPSTPEI